MPAQQRLSKVVQPHKPQILSSSLSFALSSHSHEHNRHIYTQTACPSQSLSHPPCERTVTQIAARWTTDHKLDFWQAWLHCLPPRPAPNPELTYSQPRAAQLWLATQRGLVSSFTQTRTLSLSVMLFRSYSAYSLASSLIAAHYAFVPRLNQFFDLGLSHALVMTPWPHFYTNKHEIAYASHTKGLYND